MYQNVRPIGVSLKLWTHKLGVFNFVYSFIRAILILTTCSIIVWKWYYPSGTWVDNLLFTVEWTSYETTEVERKSTIWTT